MHFPAASVLVLALASISMTAAQTAPPPVDVPSTNCITCLSTKMESVSACKALANFNPQSAPAPGALTPQEQACYCSLVTNFSWFQSCKSATACSDSFIGTLEQAYTAARGAISCTGGASAQGSSASTMGGVNQGVVCGMALTTLIALL
ncbi:hypothetical protein BGZ74_002394 [Mortierella antarctica]|nr:hypothetical protein BGZ74_002394 [Mortierella antarctica]